jgi:transketolase
MMGDRRQQKGRTGEAKRLAVKYQLSNICAIKVYNPSADQRLHHEVMPQTSAEIGKRTVGRVLEVNGHDFEQILETLEQARRQDKPVMVLAHTVMGKGVDFMENLAKYHGSTLNPEQLDTALKQLGEPNRLEALKALRQKTELPVSGNCDMSFALKADLQGGQPIVYEKDTDNRSAWGNAITNLAEINKSSPTPIVVLDCDLASSVKTNDFAARFPERFFQGGSWSTTRCSGGCFIQLRDPDFLGGIWHVWPRGSV